MPKSVPKNKSLAYVNPNLAKQWHPTKNGDLTPFDITPGSGKKAWWKCDKGNDHEWEAKIQHRNNGTRSGCPYCSNRKLSKDNSLRVISAELSNDWHPYKNGQLNPDNVIGAGMKKYWWKCNKGDDHEWKASIYNRLKGNGCPVCRGLKIVYSNSLIFSHPKIASEWHPTKNGNLTPFDVTAGSKRKVWWKCDKGDDHEWNAKLENRKQGYGCPVCSGYKIVKSNCLDTLNPKLSEQWHPTRNGELTPSNIAPFSHKRVWWVCKKNSDHIWISSVAHRSNDRNCPYCTLTPQSREELIICHELKSIFEDIDPRGFKTKINGKFWSIDIYISQLNLGIEFDGSYWHKDKVDLDKLKTVELESDGFNIIRVRQKPLKRIFDSDIMADKKFDGKVITDDILRQILKDYKLNNSIIDKIHTYLDKTKLQNEKGLDKYIDMILEEKAQKNN